MVEGKTMNQQQRRSITLDLNSQFYAADGNVLDRHGLLPHRTARELVRFRSPLGTGQRRQLRMLLSAPLFFLGRFEPLIIAAHFLGMWLQLNRFRLLPDRFRVVFLGREAMGQRINVPCSAW